jgi:O-antigen/teichoic acid export membrane protein
MISVFRNRVVRSIFGIGAAASSGHLISLAAAPIASRLFTATEFGQFGLFFSLANVLATLALLGLQDALLAAPKEQDALAILRTGLLAAVVSSPLLGLLTYLLIRLKLFGYSALPPWSAPLIALDVLAITVVTHAQMWTLRRGFFRHLAWGHFTIGAGRGVTQVATGTVGLGYGGLVISEILTRTSVALLLLAQVATDVRAAVRIPAREARAVVWRYRIFMFFRTPSTLAYNLGSALPPILVTMAHGVKESGVYTLMYGAIAVPGSLVQKAIGDVFLSHFAASFASDRSAARTLLFRNAAALLILSSTMGLIIFVWGPELFAFVFGPQWREAGVFAQLIVPLVVLDMSVGPLGGVLNVAHRPDAKLIFDVARIAGFCSAYWVTVVTHAPVTTTVAHLAWFGSVSYVIYLGLILFAAFQPRRLESGSGDSIAPLSRSQ